MKKILKFTLALIIVFFIGFACVGIVLYSGLFGVLNSFNINSVTEELNNDFKISFGKVKSAEYYIVDVYDSTDILVYEDKVTTNDIKVNLGDAINGSVYTLKVTAFNHKGKSKEANNSYDFEYLSTPSFSSETSTVLNNEDSLIYIDGDLSNKKYSLKIEKITFDEAGNQLNNKVLYNKIYSDNTYELKSDEFKDQIVKIIATLYYSDKEVDTISMFNNMNPLVEPVITSPENGSTIDYADVLLKFNESKGAEKYQLTLYNSKGVAFKNTSITENEVILDKKLFTENTTYTIGIVATKGDYSIESKSTFTIENYALDPVYMNRDVNSIKSGEQIELLSKSEGSIIYTTDGTNPLEGGLQYNGPITINEDTVINAYIKDNKKISKVSTFDIKLIDKNTKMKVYLSSSNQVRNIGAEPFTNERYELALIRDDIKKKLEENNVEVITNDFLTDYEHQNLEAENLKVNLKLSLQTESSGSHELTGMTTWISKNTSSGYSFANLINNNLSSIYNGTNNGIRYASNLSNFEGRELGENGKIPNVVLSIGYHDNSSDANWIVENRENIVETISNTILKYYGIA